MTKPAFPYYCQWESASMAEDIILGRANPIDDPLWGSSGADSAEDYAFWCGHVCGMACLKMILAQRTGKVVGAVALAKQSLPFGAYVQNGEAVKGMIYAPFEKFIRASFGIESRTHVGLSAADIPALLAQGSLFMASVHPHIRWPDRSPPGKGGHLVLVTGFEDGALVFNNPSGHAPEVQQGTRLPLAAFDAFFAGRGVEIMAQEGAA